MALVIRETLLTHVYLKCFIYETNLYTIISIKKYIKFHLQIKGKPETVRNYFPISLQCLCFLLEGASIFKVTVRLVMNFTADLLDQDSRAFRDNKVILQEQVTVIYFSNFTSCFYLKMLTLNICTQKKKPKRKLFLI